MAGVLRRPKFSSKPAFSFQDLEGDAQTLLEQAQAQARQIVARAESQARQRAAQLEQDARRQALEEGRREGLEQIRQEAAQTALEEAKQEIAQLVQSLTAALESVEGDKRRLLATAECGLLELALAIARRVCKHDVGASSAAARDNARTLLEMVKHENDLELHLNPAEHNTLGNVCEFITSTGHLEHVQIVADADIQPGGCVLHTRNGTIDASIETQLERVAEALVRGSDTES